MDQIHITCRWQRQRRAGKHPRRLCLATFHHVLPGMRACRRPRSLRQMSEGELVDLRAALGARRQLSILTEKSDSRFVFPSFAPPRILPRLRLVEPVPTCKLGIGPQSIPFFYKSCAGAVHVKRLAKIEKKMHDSPRRTGLASASSFQPEAFDLYKKSKHPLFKFELGEEKATGRWSSFYNTGNSFDFCRGRTFLPQTDPALKLMNVAGAYGRARKCQIPASALYGDRFAFFPQQKLDAHLHASVAQAPRPPQLGTDSSPLSIQKKPP